MRKHLTLTLALSALIALSVAGIAAAEKPTVVRAGNLVLTLNGGFSPTALSKTTPTPIAFSASGKLATTDGTHPPALTEFVLETDKNATVNAKGIPTCTSGALQARDTKSAEKACPTAIVGKGHTSVEVAFPDQTPSIPKIAGGSGSVTSFDLTVNRKFTYKGKSQSYLTAKCPDGHLDGKGTAIFSDGTRATGSVIRTCTGK
jgi:hypothetical protein